MISLIIGTPVEVLSQSLIPLNPDISVHPDVVNSKADLVFENDDIFVNEVYLHQLIVRQRWRRHGTRSKTSLCRKQNNLRNSYRTFKRFNLPNTY